MKQDLRRLSRQNNDCAQRKLSRPFLWDRLVLVESTMSNNFIEIEPEKYCDQFDFVHLELILERLFLLIVCFSAEWRSNPAVWQVCSSSEKSKTDRGFSFLESSAADNESLLERISRLFDEPADGDESTLSVDVGVFVSSVDEIKREKVLSRISFSVAVSFSPLSSLFVVFRLEFLFWPLVDKLNEQKRRNQSDSLAKRANRFVLFDDFRVNESWGNVSFDFLVKSFSMREVRFWREEDSLDSVGLSSTFLFWLVDCSAESLRFLDPN